MSSSLFLGIDAGQTTVKAVVHDERLRPVSVGRRDSPVESPSPRHAERSQDDLWGSAAAAVADAVAEVDAARIAAVGISGHGDGLHLVDGHGRAVMPAVTAMDSRAWREWEELAADDDRMQTILEVSGQRPPLGGSGVLLKWCQRHHPGAIEDAAAMLSCKDILRLRLVGGEPETDLSDATASFLDMRTARWSTEVLDAYGLLWAERLLPRARRATEIAGEVTPAAAEATGLVPGTPVVLGLHDVQASAIGSAALIPGRLSLVAGSFSTNGVTTEDDFVDPRWQCRVSIRPGLRIAMSTSPTAAPAVGWAVQMLSGGGERARDELLAEAAAVDRWTDTPEFLPFIQGSPLGGTASGVLAGVRGGHQRGHVFRGVLEGTAYMHLWHTRALAERYSWDAPIRLGGGVSRSALYAQLVADVLDEPVSVVDNEEPGAFGAAAVAAAGTGLVSSVAEAQDMVDVGPPIEPRGGARQYWDQKVSRLDRLASQLMPWWEAR